MSEYDEVEPKYNQNIIKMFFLRLKILPVFWILVMLSFIYGGLAGSRLKGASSDNHFAYLAQAWLDGQLHLSVPPPHGNDWASYEVITIEDAQFSQTKELKGIKYQQDFITLKGERVTYRDLQNQKKERRYFVSFPPGPAVLMLPLVWLFGIKAPDTWFTLFFAILNGILCHQLMCALRQRNGLGHIKPYQDLWLVALLTLGSAHLWCAVLGQVWYTALIIGVTFHLLYLKSVLDTSRPIRAGLYLGAAFATRPSLVLLSLIYYGQLLPCFKTDLTLKTKLKRAVTFSIPPLFIGGLLLWHNQARFESWFEFGHSYLAGGQIKRIAEYGLFHWIFLKKNLIAAFALLPLVHFQAPYLILSMHGMAVQVSSPGLLWSLAKSSKQEINPTLSVLRTLIKISMLFILGLLLLYQNTGWVQYSWRFILDLLPSLILLIALRGKELGFWFKLSVVWGILMNLIGALSFAHQGEWFKYVHLPALVPH